MSDVKNNEIVYRIEGEVSVVQASAIQDVVDLAYGLSFLANHRLYKMSKGGEGVTLKNAEAVASAFLLAAERFNEEVVSRLGGKTGSISKLGIGKVENPYRFVEGSWK